MPKISSFAEANAALLAFVPPVRQQRRYTLERMRALMKFLGNPQNTLKVLHVAGTSGKTSTSYYIAAMLQAAGFKVGMTVSPHIDEVNERTQVDGVPLPEKQFCAELEKFLPIIENFEDKPSYFEVLIAFVYWLFAKLQVDYAVVEVGLGGLLDGTNVVDRPDKVCVITDIGLDHMDVLGQTLQEIAAQKAGIIHPHNAVFTYQQGKEVMAVIRDVAAQNHSSLHEVVAPAVRQTPAKLPLFQRHNWYLASQVVEYVLECEEHEPLSKSALQLSAKILIPARMEVFKVGHKTVIIDGSHNEQKIAVLLKSIRHSYPSQPMAVLISFGHNKNTGLQASLRQLTQSMSSIIVTKFKLGQDEIRTPISPTRIVEICHKLGFRSVEAENDPEVAFRDLLKRPENLLLVTGSFYLLNHIRPLILKK